MIFSDLYSMGGFQIPLFRTEDKGKKLAELDVLSPYPVLISRVTARGFNRAPAAWMRMQKKNRK